MDIARPKNYEEIKGNLNIIKRVKDRQIDGTSSKFHIICGVPGIGKTSLAYVMSKGGNCKNPNPEEWMKDNCKLCKDIDTNVIESEVGTDNVKIFSIPAEKPGDIIKQIIGELNTNFLLEGVKYVIIDELQNAKDADQREFLKPFENIPAGVTVIACTTDMNMVIEALQQRAVIHRLRSLSSNDLKWLLKKEAYRRQLRIEEEDKAFDYIISWSDGKARPALKCLEELGKGREVAIEEIVEMIEYLPLTEIIPILTSFKSSYIKGLRVIENLSYDETTLKSMKFLLLDVLKIANRELPKNIATSDFKLVKEAISGINTEVILHFVYNVMGIQKFDSSAMIVAFLKAHPALSKMSKPNKDQLEAENASSSMISVKNKIEDTNRTTAKRDMKSMLRESAIVVKKDGE